MAAETLILLHKEMDSPNVDRRQLFPRTLGIIAFDTPFIGINPAVFAYSSYEQSKSVPRFLNYVASHVTALQNVLPIYNHEIPSNNSFSANTWRHWKAIAGAAGAATAGGIIAYLKRDHVLSGIAWVQLHLEFVSVLFKPQELETRIKMLQPNKGRIVNLYTVFHDDHGAERTFCLLSPSTTLGFTPIFLENVESEIYAHQHMFDNNVATSQVCEHMSDNISKWIGLI